MSFYDLVNDHHLLMMGSQLQQNKMYKNSRFMK